MIAVPPTPARMIAVTNGANSRIEASTKKPPRRSIAPKRIRKLPACRPGRAVAERDRRDRQREPAEPQREQELLDELGAVRDTAGGSPRRSSCPVRIIMSPTCSSRFLVGRNARSATALTTLAPPSFSARCSASSAARTLRHGRCERQGATVVCNASHRGMLRRLWSGGDCSSHSRACAPSPWLHAGVGSARTRTSPRATSGSRSPRPRSPRKQTRREELRAGDHGSQPETDKTVPNVAVTRKGFDTQLDNPDLADPTPARVRGQRRARSTSAACPSPGRPRPRAARRPT